MPALAPADILDRVPALHALNEEDRARIAAQGRVRTLSSGSGILRAGQQIDGLHVILSGRVRLVNDRAPGPAVTIDVVSEGACLGESSLWAEEASHVSAYATGEVVLFTVFREDLTAVLESRPDIETALRQFRTEEAIRGFITHSTIFSLLSREQLDWLVRSLRRTAVPAGKILIREGDPATELYIVESGRFRVYLTRDPNNAVATLERGMLAGEIGLLTGSPRTANVAADTAASVFVLSKEVFLALVEQQKRFASSVDDLVKARTPPRVAQDTSLKDSRRPEADTNQEKDETVHWQEPTIPARGSRLARLRPFPAVRQQSVMDCGAACLATVSRFYGKHVSLNRMRELARVAQSGASMLNLFHALEAMGFEVVPMLATFEQLGRTHLPAIVNWRGYHWIVVYKVGPDSVTVADPGEGVRKIPKAEFLDGWTRYTLYLRPTERFLGVEENKPALAQFFSYLLPFGRLVAEIGLAALAIQILALLLPMFTKFVIDDVVIKQDQRWLMPALLAMGVMVALSLLLSLCRQKLLLFVSLRLNLRLIGDFYKHLLSLPLPFFENRKVGDIATRFGENETINRFFTQVGPDLPIDAITAVLYLGLMAYYNVPLMLVAVFFVGLNILNVRLLTPYLRQGHREAFQRTAETQSHLVESLTGLRTIKTLGIEQYVRWTWENLFARFSNAFFSTIRYSTVSNLASELINSGSSVAILFYGATLVLDNRISLGTLVAFTTMMNGLAAPSNRLVSVWNEFQQTLNSIERLNDVLETPPELPPTRGDGQLVIHRLRGHVRFENVTFRYYEDAKNVLQNITLEVQPGQRIALVGRSGSGKSTLVKLLLGFYPASSGTISIDGFAQSALWLPSLRRQIGVVPQESFLFRSTIRDNIAQARPNASMADVVQAAKRAAAHDFISALPKGYDTMLEERGTNLSGGQRQRVAIARAILQDPRMLILDEATSALDTESERQFQGTLETVFGDRTIFMIAHRLSTVRHADRIFVLDRGVIIEQGNHDELMTQRGLYYFLASQQLSL